MSGASRQRATTIGKAMSQLSKQPIPYLKPTVKSLILRLAPRNGHWGARYAGVIFISKYTKLFTGKYRHFLKEDLPRIAYANPNVVFHVDKSRQLTIERPWAPSLKLEFGEFFARSCCILLPDCMGSGRDKTRYRGRWKAEWGNHETGDASCRGLSGGQTKGNGGVNSYFGS